MQIISATQNQTNFKSIRLKEIEAHKLKTLIPSCVLLPKGSPLKENLKNEIVDLFERSMKEEAASKIRNAGFLPNIYGQMLAKLKQTLDNLTFANANAEEIIKVLDDNTLYDKKKEGTLKPLTITDRIKAKESKKDIYNRFLKMFESGEIYESDMFSDKEKQIFKLKAEGKTNKDIAEIMNMCPQAVSRMFLEKSVNRLKKYDQINRNKERFEECLKNNYLSELEIEIINSKLSGVSTSKLIEKYNLSEKQIYKILNKVLDNRKINGRAKEEDDTVLWQKALKLKTIKPIEKKVIRARLAGATYKELQERFNLSYQKVVYICLELPNRRLKKSALEEENAAVLRKVLEENLVTGEQADVVKARLSGKSYSQIAKKFKKTKAIIGKLLGESLMNKIVDKEKCDKKLVEINDYVKRGILSEHEGRIISEHLQGETYKGLAKKYNSTYYTIAHICQDYQNPEIFMAKEKRAKEVAKLKQVLNSDKVTEEQKNMLKDKINGMSYSEIMSKYNCSKRKAIYACKVLPKMLSADL